jgi:hypothetical protein
MRSLLLLALAALVGCGQPPQLGGRQSHGPPVATAGNWTPSEAAVQAALAGFPNTPFSSGGGGPVATTTGSFSGTITSTVASGGQALNIIGGAKACLNAACTTAILDDGFGTMNLNSTGGISTSQAIVSLTDYSNTGVVGTAGSGTGISTIKTGLVRTFVSKITVARTALTAAATTQDITLWTIPAKTRMWRLIADVTAAFDDAAGPISAVTLTCGKTAGGNEYLLSKSVFATTQMGTVTGEVGASLATYFGDIPSWSATTAVQCRWTSTGGNLSTLTTGSATFYLEWTNYP